MQPSYGLSGTHRHYPHQQRQRQHQHQHQQLFEGDSSCSSLFSISTPQNLNHPFHFHTHQQPKQQNPQNVFLQQQQHLGEENHLQLLQNQQQFIRPIQQGEERLHIRQQNPSFFTANFKLGLNENSSRDKEEKATNFLHGNQQSNSPQAFHMPHCWHPQEDSSTIKEPFWKPPNRGNSQSIQGENEDQEGIQGNNTSEQCKNLENKYGFFGELEAIYSLAKIAESNQTGSGSVLTGENSQKKAGLSMQFNALHVQNVGAIATASTAVGVDHGSENSIGEEAKSRKRKRTRKMQEKLSLMGGFFEKLVKQVMDHQKMLHRSFLEKIERLEKERKWREETWRRQEAEKHNKEAIARAHEKVLASSREAQIVTYIEKIAGQSINLPTRKTPLLLQQEIPKERIKNFAPILKLDNRTRWPKSEVEALIHVRSSIEVKFQEPGLKGPLWEEVSSVMCSMGYQRSAKRCKEKWENINKYFRKAKESTKKRALNTKTCSYFNQLDQLYLRTVPHIMKCHSPHSISDVIGVEREGSSEFLEAFMAGKDLLTTTNPSTDQNMKIAEMSSSRLEVDGIVVVVDDELELEQGSHGNEKEGHNEGEENNEEEHKERGGGGESGDSP